MTKSLINILIGIVLFFQCNIVAAQETIFELACIERPSPFSKALPDAIRYKILINTSAKTAMIQSTNSDYLNCLAEDLTLETKKGEVSNQFSSSWNFTCDYSEGMVKVMLENFQEPSEMLPTGSPGHIALMGLRTSDTFDIRTLACLLQ
ncbi:MAG: hypothetical protein KDD34_09410 [Bdellovibrionales bacterium]|nr:hypothetical protein [Bdellovibrionales bacterium]